jgi:hypothetical protein
LHIEYEYTESKNSAEESVPPDFSSITIPEHIYLSLKEAAEVYSVTELGRYLDAVAKLGEDGQLLAEHLRQLSRNYDMEAILNILSEVRQE